MSNTPSYFDICTIMMFTSAPLWIRSALHCRSVQQLECYFSKQWCVPASYFLRVWHYPGAELWCKHVMQTCTWHMVTRRYCSLNWYLVPIWNNYCILKLVLVPVFNNFCIIKLVLVPILKNSCILKLVQL